MGRAGKRKGGRGAQRARKPAEGGVKARRAPESAYPVHKSDASEAAAANPAIIDATPARDREFHGTTVA